MLPIMKQVVNDLATSVRTPPAWSTICSLLTLLTEQKKKNTEAGQSSQWAHARKIDRSEARLSLFITTNMSSEGTKGRAWVVCILKDREKNLASLNIAFRFKDAVAPRGLCCRCFHERAKNNFCPSFCTRTGKGILHDTGLCQAMRPITVSPSTWMRW